MANQNIFGKGSVQGLRLTNWLHWLKVGTLGVTMGLLAACGGGGVSAPTTVGGDLQVLPGSTDMFANTPVTFTISGGQRPYSAFSSNSSVLPLNITIANGNTFVATATNPTTDTAVTITVRDSAGKTTTAAANVKATTLLNQLTVSASTNAGNSCGGAQVCSGSEAIASVSAQLNGSPLQNRAIRFEIVSGSLTIVSGSGTAASVTINTDSRGVAIATLRASVGIPSGYTVLRAVDVTSGQTVSYVITVGQTIDPTAITITPNNFQWTGPFKDACATGALTSHLVTGGTPPYTVRQSIPDFAVIAGSPLAPPSVPVPANGTTLGINFGSILVTTTGLVCSTGSNGNTITVTDAIGRVATFNIGNTVGSADRPTSPSVTLPVPTLTPNVFTGVICGVSVSSFVSQTVPSGYTGSVPIISAIALEPLRINAQINNGILTMTRRSTDPGGGAQTRVRVSNGTNFSDITLDLSGAAPFSCAGGTPTTTTPITTSTGTTLDLAAGAAPRPSKQTTIAGGVPPYTISVAAPNFAELSTTGAAYSQSITITAGQPLLFFARAVANPPGPAAGAGAVTFITIQDSATPTPQSLILVVQIQ